MEFDVLARKYLKTSNIKINQEFLSKRLISHPDYPSLTSLTDTLSELKIDHIVLQADKNKADQLFYPLLIHISGDENKTFKIIKSYEQIKNVNEDILKTWDGTVLMIDRTSTIQNEDYKRIDKYAADYFKASLWLSIIAGLIFLIAYFIDFNLTAVLISLLSIAGSFICTLIVLKNMGKRNTIIDKLCKADDNEGCNKVLQSKVAVLFFDIGLGDIGLIYFVSIFLYLLIGQIFQSTFSSLQLLIVPTALAVIGTFFSLWYQWWVVKSWCKMCLIVVGILWAQAIVLSLSTEPIIPSDNNIFSTLPMQFYLVFILSFLLIFTAWFFIKRLHLKLEEYNRKEIETMIWKRNPQIFFGFLRQQRQVNNDYLENDIVLGNLNAPLQFIIACNPYCAPCAKTHLQLDEFLKIYPGQIGITIRFALNTMEKTDTRFIAVEHILNACFSSNDDAQILNDWFNNMDLDLFKEKYPIILNTYNNQTNLVLQQHINWTSKNKITYTPTVFFNGYELPKQYTIEDVKLLIPTIAETHHNF